MNRSADRPDTRLATRLSFFAAGFAVACWAPLVPFAKANVGVGDGRLGLLLLCLGIGSVVAMPMTGWLSARLGSKPLILGGGLGLVLLLPALAAAESAAVLAAALLLFGASLGTTDVAMNVHAVEVERAARIPLMSGFHALYSVGGFVGAGGMTFLLSAGATPVLGSLCASVLTLVAVLFAWPRLLASRDAQPGKFAAPRGSVLLLAGLAAATFLVEGAILDWSALLLVDRSLVGAAQAGIGYMVFAAAMTIGRLTGDRIVAAAGNRRVLLVGGSLAIGGIVVLLIAPWTAFALIGFVLIGLGAANVVPVLFSLAGRQTALPAGLAIAAVTTTGYAGKLAGPAALGFVSHATSLPTAFWLLAALMALVPLCARAVTR
jgi:MFS family permease